MPRKAALSSRLLKRVAERVRCAASEACDLPVFRDLLVALLSRPGRILAEPPASHWSALVFETCRVLGGERELAIDGAAAVECFVAACEILDDVVDDDWDDQLGLSWQRAANASLAFSLLATYCINRGAEPPGPERARMLSALLARGGIDACAGEDRDLAFETILDVSVDDAYEMTGRKSASVVSMACQIGAAVASDDPAVLALAGRFGKHLGIVEQILDDLSVLDPKHPGGTSDRRRRKKTVPVAYALRCAQEEDVHPVLDWYRDDAKTGDSDEKALATAMRDLGAVHYAWVIADAHRREALAVLRELVRITDRRAVLTLGSLVPRLPSSGGTPT